MKIGRNDPCPCGSGKKYKKCCELHSPVEVRSPELYEAWQREPEALPASWQMFFRGFELATCPRACVAAERAHAQSRVNALIDAYRVSGHLQAHLDPLGEPPPARPELEPSAFGLGRADLDRVFDASLLATGGPTRARLRDIIGILHQTYCRSIGVEYMHIQDAAIRRWLQEQMEPVRNRPGFARDKKLALLGQLLDAELFERFLQRHFGGYYSPAQPTVGSRLLLDTPPAT